MKLWFILMGFGLTLLYAGASSALATEIRVTELSDKNVRLEIPGGWTQAKDFLGVPWVWLGPQAGMYRPVIFLMEAPSVDLDFDPSRLSKAQTDYQAGRQAWLSRVNGKLVRFEPYQFRKSGNALIHTIGVRYQLAENELIEKTHYIRCGQSLYHLKTLLPATQEKEFSKAMTKAAESFACEH